MVVHDIIDTIRISTQEVRLIFGDHSGAITICYVQDNIPEVVDIEDTLVDSDWVATITIPAKELDPVHS